MNKREKLIELIRYAPKVKLPFGGRANGKEYQTAGSIADHILADEEIKHAFELLKAEKEGRLIVPPCKVGETVYCIYSKKVIEGTVRLIRPFISEKDTVFKGNIICEVDNPFFDDGSKEEIELYVVFEKPYGIERIAYISREDAEKALEERKEK